MIPPPVLQPPPWRDAACAAGPGPGHAYGLGMRRVLLIISEPDSANISTSGWNCHGPSLTIPNQMSSPIAPCQAATASTTTSAKLVGIGVPSKYLTLSPPPESCSAVTL